jgi:4-hydroxy-4-methyl-2-oxoglutarate aldolase
MPNAPTLSHSELLQLKRWNTPTIYNGWEQITAHDAATDAFNPEPTTDFMPQMGPMIGYATTLIVELSNKTHKSSKAWEDYRAYLANVPGPKIAVVQDLDKPNFVGSFWGEVNSNTHRALGCVGTITDGCIRDLDEMANAGFKALAQRLCVGHAHSCPVKWNCEVEVFGRKIHPNQLIHADRHGFLAIPQGEEKDLLDAAQFMDRNECQTVIPAARDTTDLSKEDLLNQLNDAAQQFGKNTRTKFSSEGEW